MHPDFREAMTGGYWEASRSIERNRHNLPADRGCITLETSTKFLHMLAHDAPGELDRLADSAYRTIYRSARPRVRQPVQLGDE